jgi:hypothetical protein
MLKSALHPVEQGEAGLKERISLLEKLLHSVD